MAMTAADHSGAVPDLYRVLGVSRAASDGEIRRAWRRRALAEHPDCRPRDAAAPARFRALAEAYRVLGDPARRAAYDRLLGDLGAAAAEGSASGAPAGRRGSGVPVTVRAAGRVPEPPLRAGPARVEVPGPVSLRTAPDDDLARLALLAELAERYLAGDGGRPW